MKRMAFVFVCLSTIGAIGLTSAREIPFKEERVVSTDVYSPLVVHAADVDGDGDRDLIAGGLGLFWFENISGKYGTEKWIGMDPPTEFYDLATADIDGDGKLDVISAGSILDIEGDGLHTAADANIVWWESDVPGGVYDWNHHAIGMLGNADPDAGMSSRAYAVVAADMDDDGDVDVVTGGVVSFPLNEVGRITWYDNDGSGGFTALHSVALSPGETVLSLDLADMDFDGDMDVVAGHGGGVVWYENQASTLVEHEVSTTSFTADDVFAARVDYDGDIDVIAVSWDTNQIVWYESLITHFDEVVLSSPAADAPKIFAVDMDQNGWVDVAASYGDGRIVWFDHPGGYPSPGTWIERTVATTLAGGTFVTAADVDDDGDLDLLATSKQTLDPASGDKIVWHENRTIHRNAVFPPLSIVVTSQETFAVTATDMNNDSIPDPIAATAPLTLESWRTVHRPDFSFNYYQTISIDVVDAESVAASDFDDDGDRDLVVAGKEISVYDNSNGLGDYLPETVISGDPTTSFHDAVPVDIDGDGALEIVSAGEPFTVGADTSTVAVWERSTGPTEWRPDFVVPVGLTNSARSLTVADVDRDGDTDILTGGITSTFDGVLVWAANNGTSFSVGQEIVLPFEPVAAVAAGDLDEDGDVDLVVGLDDEALWYENTDGAGTFAFDPNMGYGGVIFRAIGGGVRQLSVADLDKDGDLDVAAVVKYHNRVYWYENLDGSADFWADHLIKLGGSPNAVFLADLGGDDDIDALVGSEFDGLQYYPNLGGQFTSAATDLAQVSVFEGQSQPMLSVTYTVHARPGDSVGELAQMRLIFEESPTVPLDNLVANALVERVLIYRDDGSGEFAQGADILVHTVDDLTLVDGVERIALPDDDKNLRIAAPATFYVVVELAADASLQTPNAFSVRDDTAKLEDAQADIALTPAFSSHVLDATVTTVHAPIQVDTDADAIVVDAFTSLREAVIQANGQPGDDKIVLPPGDYVLSIAGTDEDGAATGDLDITDTTGNLIIEGAGAERTTIDANGIDRVFHVGTGAMADLAFLTIRGGLTSGASTTGGGIANDGGIVRLVHTTVTRNTASANGGGIYSALGGELILDASVVSDNSVTGPGGLGGGVFANAPGGVAGVTGWASTISGNSAAYGGGAGLYGAGSADFWLTTISGNTATNMGGALFVDTNVTLEGCTITDNLASVSGGGIQFVGVAGEAYFGFARTIVAGNVAPVGPDGNNSGTAAMESNDQVLVGDNSDFSFFPGDGDLVGTALTPLDPMLGPLDDNGGFNLTHALLPGSPAIDQAECPPGDRIVDQRDARRPVDLPEISNFADGCDIGAYELEFGQTLPWIEIPVRWCVVKGAATFGATPDQALVNLVLRQRHETATDKIWDPQTKVRFRSAANEKIRDYPILDDPDPTIGSLGDVYVDPQLLKFGEFKQLIADCRAAWQALDPAIVGITAVQINQFVDAAGQPTKFLGLGGRANPASPANSSNAKQIAQQMAAGRVMVVDGSFVQTSNPPDLVEYHFAHELGHAVALRHGDGIDNDNDGILDNDDDKAAQKPRYDGPNLMQYRDGKQLTIAQVQQVRDHVLITIPDIDTDPSISALADATPVDGEWADILDFEWADMFDFEWADMIDFEWADMIDFEWADMIDFEWADMIDFGISYDGTTNSNSTTVSATTGGMPWPSPIRPDTSYLFYLDLDQSDATGGIPSDEGFPLTSLAVEKGVDVVIRVDMSAACPGDVCTVDVALIVYDYNDTTDDYEEVYSGVAQVEPVGVGLYQDTGGAEPAFEDQPMGVNARATIPNSVLQAAGWTVGDPIDMEVVTSVPCVTTLPNGTSVHCQCTDCLNCPDYPGCGEDENPADDVPNPQGLCSGGLNPPCRTDSECAASGSGTCVFGDVVPDAGAGTVDFVQPFLPQCTVTPSPAGPGSAVTITASGFPTDTEQPFEVQMGSAMPNTHLVPFDLDGDAQIMETVPTDAGGDLLVTVVLQGFATAARCYVCTDTSGTDLDGDGVCDGRDPDDDNDGVGDIKDTDTADQSVCGDTDGDGCDDCWSGRFDPANDGPDFDGDGLCDEGDPDDDNDGVDDAADMADHDPYVCGSGDGDICDDCSSGTYDPDNDGLNFDPDGPCDEAVSVSVDPTPVDEGSTATVTVMPDSESAMYFFDCDGNGVYDLEGEAPGDNDASCFYADNGLYNVNVKVVSGNAEATAHTVVQVNNVAPTVGEIVGPLEPLPEGSVAAVSAAFSDPGVFDTHTAVWDWGDGSHSLGTVVESGGSGTVNDDHQYNAPGVHTVSLTVTDKDGGVGVSVFRYVVIYDPSAGFVTGGGWIDSLAGAYIPDPSLTGKASFGFVSKYKKGASAPTGNTEFQFRTADLNFHSDDYEWLVVAGPKAQFKGSGRINGAGNYGFMLFAVDAALTPSIDVDLFRIKIWNKDASDAVVYDNEPAEVDDADPTTQIGGGSIVVHKGKK